MPQFNDAAATLPASDFERAKAFYGGTLGLESFKEDAGGYLPGRIVERVRVPEPVRGTEPGHGGDVRSWRTPWRPWRSSGARA